MHILRTILLLLFIENFNFCLAQSDLSDTTKVRHIGEAVVSRKRITTPVKGETARTLTIDMKLMDELPKILGNADPLHYAQLLPGVQTNSEYDAGFHIRGCESQHNLIALDNVPIYNAAHLLGFFSVFNATHFKTMELSGTTLHPNMSNHLGGAVNMTLNTKIPQHTNGELMVGPMSSQGTIRLPLSRKWAVTISGRQAYLNPIYGRWLKVEGSQMTYSFGDYNATLIYKQNERHNYKLNVYYGNDCAGFSEPNYNSNISLRWNNLVASVDGSHKIGNGTLEHKVYLTENHNKFDLDMMESSFQLPSSICDWGAKVGWKMPHLKLTTEIVYHTIQPQSPSLSDSYHISYEPQPKQKTLETAFSAEYNRELIHNFHLSMGVRAQNYTDPSRYNHPTIDPMCEISFKPTWGETFLRCGLQHQYLFKTGFSNMGMPTEFWISADKNNPQQYALTLSLGQELPLLDNQISLSAEVYYKRLYNQLEYKGDVFDFMTTDYTLNDCLLHGRGTNYGFNIMLNHKVGKLKGWVSYSFGRATRNFTATDLPGKYPANHERIHELNAVGTYRFNKHWDIGATIVLASGTPFTAPERIYLINGYIVTEFGEHNASRLRPYFRIDASVNYNFKKTLRTEQGFNLSLYNVSMHKNELFYRVKFYKEKFAYRGVSFLLKILPSINYYLKF